MTSTVVLTTINAPSEIIDKWIALDHELIVVGDRKTPGSFSNLPVRFLDVAEQESQFPEFSAAVPFNHYSRKNLGYLHAIKNGATTIAETDDDNIPLAGWPKLPDLESVRQITSPRYPNVYRLFSDQHVWPRGFPLDRINLRQEIEIDDSATTQAYIWQGMVNGDPDVDAIYRLTSEHFSTEGFAFRDAGGYVLAPNVLCAFNTQNTVWTEPKAFPYLYLPCTVSFRATDIIKSYVAQYCIWALGGGIGFYGPTALQERNEHNFLKDLESEWVLYVRFDEMMRALDEVQYTGMPQDLYLSYEALSRIGITEKRELNTVELWLRQLED
ncbi:MULTISPECIES: hypothetical protein [unclassified Ruegeria]|uniref:hypothetical protein n=1 Tax=unclassified Ruegeria TaxID=2625375 RepID=UPI001ADAC09B|nr:MULTISPECIES: hypothetical protein [unclassified Ruegeria]MBO9413798.1 hypothetical protein [Ruegeria sp. R8_1]MBO9417732.1 hypothetical protein [Ruegeria sp. R8_2]